MDFQGDRTFDIDGIARQSAKSRRAAGIAFSFRLSCAPAYRPLLAARKRAFMATETFKLYLIKPSHYDDDGYVIQWLRSAIPSNTLAALHGLAADCAARKVLGDEVRIEITGLDETNTRIRPEKIAAAIHAAGRGLVCLVGVQSNQFP